jgi:hypothetical protein
MATGSTIKLALPYPLTTDQVNVSGDIKQLATKIDNILQETVEDYVADSLTGGTFSNGIEPFAYDEVTGSINVSLSQDLRSTASPSFASLNLSNSINLPSSKNKSVQKVIDDNDVEFEVDSFDHSEYSSAEYLIQLKQGSAIRFSRILLIWDGAEVLTTEYAIIESEDKVDATFIFSESSGDAYLKISSDSALAENIYVKAQATLISS